MEDPPEPTSPSDFGSPAASPVLPSDLPTSLDDRRYTHYDPGVEVYDAWQGQSQFYTGPTPSKPLDFKLGLDESPDLGSRITENEKDRRLDQMIAAQEAYRQEGEAVGAGNEESIANDKNMSETNKRQILQKALTMAASNGELDKLSRLLSGNAKQFVDINAADEEGNPPLIYASCFGHEDVVAYLLEAGALVDRQDSHHWTPLMWATNNRHKGIVKTLLEHGASQDVRSSSGRTAWDFVEPDTDMSEFLQGNGYAIGSIGVGEDFYSSGLSQDRFEEELAENELRRRMMMESAANLEVDLGNLGLDERPETPEDADDSNDFVWDRCLNDQMFVFQESDLERILDIVITNMTPQRSPSQKPVPANILFLSARYAHYHANSDLLEMLFVKALEKINNIIDKYQWDMTMLAFWMSNATLLLHYLKKDAGLVTATTPYQLEIAELINELFVLIIRDAERRIDKVFDTALLEHETIPGFEDVHFQHEWNLFKSKNKPKSPEPPEKQFRPPSPKRRAKPSPRNVTSLLASTLFVLDLYDIHSVITAQLLAQLYYWLGAELFNRVMSNRKYLARTKAMQTRMNVSVLEEWARNNNRHPEHYENGSTSASGDSVVDATRHYLAPVIQLLQWLQVFSSIGENEETLETTMKQLPRLTPQQLIHAVKYYRPEVGEKTLPKKIMKKLAERQKEYAKRRAQRRKEGPQPQPQQDGQNAPQRPGIDEFNTLPDDDGPEHLLLDSSFMLPFTLPTATDMIVSYGAGLGGMNRERERKYIPTVPAEFLAKLDPGGRRESRIYGDTDFNEQDDDDDNKETPSQLETTTT